MSETKAAFSEREREREIKETKRQPEDRAIQSLKLIIYRYIEDHGKSFIHKRTQFVSTRNCRVNHLEMSRILISSQFCKTSSNKVYETKIQSWR